MDDSKKWYDFIIAAQSLLLKGQLIDSYKPNIQIAIEHSLDNCVFLQLVIDNDIVQWYKTTWVRVADASRFSDPIEHLKYIGQTIKPTIKYESGTTAKENLLNIMEFARALSIQPCLDQPGGFIVDGVSYTLMIGVATTHTIYKWHYLPDNWNSLQILANMLEAFNDNFCSDS